MQLFRNKRLVLLLLVSVIAGALLLVIFLFWPFQVNELIGYYTGSAQCKSCHEESHYQWSESMHGLTMQKVTPGFINLNIPKGTSEIGVEGSLWIIEVKQDSLTVTLKDSCGITDYDLLFVIGGKYVYYFITEIEGGRLQVIPAAWDIRQEVWYNSPESGVRHLADINDEALSWKDQAFTFNTSCFGCHVSQATINFDLDSNKYYSEWIEEGINCEACHGPGSNHVDLFSKARRPDRIKDPAIISLKSFTPEQTNHNCSSCHAKATLLTNSYIPGDNFYNHFDLVTLENLDYYPDGRDLGENYTFTSWEMNSCTSGGKITCLTCHTSSGKLLFGEGEENRFCLPCHSERSNDIRGHTGHDPEGAGSKCISCHMPKTSFAFMDRSDHSFRPPYPTASITYGSPNACNICHAEKDAAWAEKEVIKMKGNYQFEQLTQARYLDELRRGDYKSTKEIAQGLSEGKFNPVFASSFLRLLLASNDNDLLRAAALLSDDPHPLVRSSAMAVIAKNAARGTIDKKLEAEGLLLPRISAGRAIAEDNPGFLQGSIDLTETEQSVINEFLATLTLRNGSWASWYNLGSLLSLGGDFGGAIEAYEIAIKLNQSSIVPRINLAIVKDHINDKRGAEEQLLIAEKLAPESEPVLLNLALLYGELQDSTLSVSYFRRTLAVNPRNSVAAANLGLLLYKSNIKDALKYARLAIEINPDNPKYISNLEWLLSQPVIAK